ncbi:optineurin isoform X2 [Xenopus tropicalis]|uniref:Optineurin n=1 Tax=Xenopus tropicalis TaxID=8364 RepID=A0A8J0T2L1_XENTR|nr:optineurin isoform X2 [Xenopus tropicalis]|eukprot:XP_017947826.1 PREDICTED: optineurin isoform X2 [Xenopus tropicalis]
MENGLLKHPHVINMENGHQDASCDVFSMKNDAEMLEQIKQLLMENNNLKETMKQMNQEMKERLEELLKRHNQHLLDLNSENELLRKELNSLREKNATSNQGIPVCSNPEETSESKQLKTQLMRLQAEKADLLGLISELQLKLSGFSEDSFVEIRISEKESGEIIHEEKANKTLPDYDVSYRTNSVKEEGSGTEPEEVAISRLLRSLREETQKVERLEKELSEHKRLAELKEKTSRFCDKDMQTEQEKQNQSEEIFLLHAFFQISSEVDILKQKVKSLNKELQETNDKLNEAKQLKNSLQEKCILLDKRLQENAVDLEEKQNLRYTIKKLELQVESMESEIKLERNKTEAEKNQLAILQVAYDKLNSEYQETRIRESEKVSKVEFNDLVEKLDACEKALAKKQFEIDEIRQMDAKHKEDIETIGLLRAQIDVYCADFHAERSARENIHQEKEQLEARLAYMIQESEKLKAEMMGRQSIEQLQRRHSCRLENVSGGPYLVPRGAENMGQPSITVYTCPKCNLTVPDIDTLQIHVMDCIT